MPFVETRLAAQAYFKALAQTTSDGQEFEPGKHKTLMSQDQTRKVTRFL